MSIRRYGDLKILDFSEIKAMQPGRELDIRIAELITGQSRFLCRQDPINRNGEPQFHWGYPVGHDFAPAYSTDIGAAFLVVDFLQGKDARVAINTTCDAGKYDLVLGNGWQDTDCLVFEPLALGICKLALMWEERERAKEV